MNPLFKTTFLTTVFLSTMLVFSSGCSKKTVVPPDGSPAGESEMNGGIDINYPSADDSYSESGLAEPEPMDSESGGQVIGNLSINSADQQHSEEYMRVHGRSSIVFSPIYFEFDQSGISAEMRPIITANANYMKDNPSIVIVIEGNCDERGTNEYNLALGERRAINAKEYMVNLGVDPARIRTVSYGEERQLFIGQTELDWSQNRRADFIVE